VAFESHAWAESTSHTFRSLANNPPACRHAENEVRGNPIRRYDSFVWLRFGVVSDRWPHTHRQRRRAQPRSKAIMPSTRGNPCEACEAWRRSVDDLLA
jgi:hypothetical protein